MKLYDFDVYNTIAHDDLWVYDKLILSKKLGHICGPAGIPVPTIGIYIVKPITNILGMGHGSFIHNFVTTNTSFLPAGTFWMELFTGQHLSIDIINGTTDVVYEGVSEGLQRFVRWTKLDIEINHPQFIIELSKKYEIVNYESIGGKIIEVHLRGNPDWHQYKANVLIPVWKGEKIPTENFVYDEDQDRIGFVILK